MCRIKNFNVKKCNGWIKMAKLDTAQERMNKLEDRTEEIIQNAAQRTRQNKAKEKEK